jgi:hypothetical protein
MDIDKKRRQRFIQHQGDASMRRATAKLVCAVKLGWIEVVPRDLGDRRHAVSTNRNNHASRHHTGRMGSGSG